MFRLRGLDRRGHRRAARARSASRSRASACATCSGSRPTCWPACCRGCTRRCSRSPTPTRTRDGRSTSAPPPRRRWPSCSPIVLTFDGAVGSRSEVVDGLYTGRAGGPFTYREGKAQAIRELAERERIDLGASYAYSDSESDLPMLRAVGHPVAVNPDAELARVAREEGWDVLRFERLGRRLKVAGAAGARCALAGGLGSVAVVEGARMSLARADRRAARDPRARAPLRRRADRAAGRRVGPRAPLPARAVRARSASSG